MAHSIGIERKDKKERVRVCVAECRSVLGDKRRNVAAACAALAEASRCGADLIALPELFITGYDVSRNTDLLAESSEPEAIIKTADTTVITKTHEHTEADTDSVDLIVKAPKIKDHEPNSATMIGKAAADNRISVIYGFPEFNESGKPYNSANLIGSDGCLIGTYRKTHLFGDEDKFFEAGTEYPVFDTPLGRIGIMICYDVEFPEPARYLAEGGADFLVAISANMEPYNTEHKLGIPARARENSIYIAYCNYTGRDRKYKYCGQSVIVDPSGDRISGQAALLGEYPATEDRVDAFSVIVNDSEHSYYSVDFDYNNYGMRLMYADIDIG